MSRKGPKPRPPEERFWEKVDKAAPSGCWVWSAARYPNGYGLFNAKRGHTALAHRFAYEALVGPIPAGLTIDHLCRNTLCVNPAHMEPVTMRENILRGESPAARGAVKTHCPQGHLYDQANTKIKNGSRNCRACAAARERRRRAEART